MANAKAGIVKAGTSANDVITGSDREDRLSGGGGNDQIFAGAGNDRIGGGAGNDTLNGGSGNDRVDGDAGNDVLIYVAGENRGSCDDDYDGGTGIDTLQLVLTRNEWLQTSVQNDVARYLNFISGHLNPHGEATGQRFNFTAFNLDAAKIEKLQIKVDGVLLDARDQAVDARDDALRVSEDAARATGNVITGTSAAGADLVPDLVRSVQLIGAPAGGAITNASGNYTYASSGHGTLTLSAAGNFTFTPGSAFNSLRVGQTATETFTYRVTDADGDTDTAKLVVTIVGANDAPIAGAALVARVAAPEQLVQFTLPANAFADPDRGDVLVYSARQGNGAALPSWLTFNAATKTFSGTPRLDDIGQTFAVKVSVSDGNGGSASQAFSLNVGGNLITGTAADETLTGTATNDYIKGLDGNDQLYGGGAADLLEGGLGNDGLFGEAGNDVLRGGAGNDQLIDALGNNTYAGGEGDDFIQHFSFDNVATAVMDGGAGNDFLWAQGLVRADVKGGAGSDNVIVYYVENASVDLGADNDFLRIISPHAIVSGGAGNDQVTVDGGSATIDLGAGNDELWSYSSERQTVTTGAGSDLIVPVVLAPNGIVVTDFTLGAGGDVLEYSNLLAGLVGWNGSSNPFTTGHVRLTQSGADTLFEIDTDGAANGASFVSAVVFKNLVASTLGTANLAPAYDSNGSPVVPITGTDNGETLNGTSSDDTMLALGGDDFVYGFEGSDNIDGGGGNDFIDGGIGDDTLHGGEGNDTLRDDDGNNIFDGGAGNDDVQTSSTGSAAANLGDGDNFFYSLFGGQTGGTVQVTAGSGADQIIANFVSDGSSIFAGEGNNNISAIFNGTGAIQSGAGNDQVSVSGNMIIDSGGGADVLSLSGSGTVNAGSGDDYLFVQNTGLTITTGGGADRIAITVLPTVALQVTDFTPGAGGDVLNLDWISNQYLTGWDLSTNPFGEFFRVTQIGTDAHVQVDTDGNLSGTSFVDLAVFRNVNASALNSDNFIPPYPPNGAPAPGLSFSGTNANDTFTGGLGNDTFMGFGGDDSATTYQGNDVLDGGDGNDTLDGGYGTDQFFGGDGNDSIYDAVSPSVFVDAGLGDDFVYSQAAAGTVNLGSGDDVALLSGGTTLSMGAGSDTLIAYVGIAPATTTLSDFTLASGADKDVLDLRQLLSGYDPATSTLGDFVTAQQSGSSTVISVDRDGLGGDFYDVAILQGVTQTLDALLLNGNVLVA